MRHFLFRPLLSLAVFAFIIGQHWLVADGPNTPVRKRAKPPKWDKRIVDSFFSDARSTLEGPRPNFGTPGAGSSVVGPTTPSGGSPPSDSGDPAAAGSFAWSKIITADALQDEIKSYQAPVKNDVKSASDFKGNLFKHARDDFSMLAVAFGVLSEYDGEVRWKTQALAARDLFARAGFNCKVATDQAFSEAKARADDLGNLVRGDTIPAAPNADAKLSWSKVANRPPLMHRLDAAQNQLQPWTSNAADFSKNLDHVDHEAQVMAVIADVIQREGFEFTDDKAYLGFARDMEKHALEVSAAAKAKNFDQARIAVGDVAKACSNCHGGFRS
jgi:hypothetical protein